jgi:hypothetical protein
MKPAAVALLMLFALPAFAGEVLSTRIFSTDARSENLPGDLHFSAQKIHVLNGAWYNSIFEEPGCESVLTEKDLNSPIEIKATGPHELELSLNRHWSPRIHSARASYVPLYYKNGVPVHPHFMIKLKDWVLLHATIHKSGATKTLKLSLVQGRGADIHLVPILEATGI